jgi:NAD(P)-dependent dehydrogenase (short-subunit alcohol dehydrogenase family)
MNEQVAIQKEKMTNLKNLKDQVIVITGASSGIGLVTARMAAAKGAKVVLAARNEEALHELTDELQQAGHEAIYVKADVGLEEDVIRIAETAMKEFGRFDTWVNNAGVGIYGRAMDVSDQDMKRLFATNYWGVVYGSRTAVRYYLERGDRGALINVGSIFGDRGTLVQSAYASSKFAVHGWTDSLRMECEREGVPVSITLIHPAKVDTPYNEHARSYEEYMPVHKGMIYPPEAVAEAILYAAVNPKRDVYVGSQAKMLQFLGSNFPRFTDKLWEAVFPPTQYDKHRHANSLEDSNLYHAGYGLHERGTNLGWKRKSSIFVKAAKHPVITRIILASVGAWVLTKMTRKGDD